LLKRENHRADMAMEIFGRLGYESESIFIRNRALAIYGKVCASTTGQHNTKNKWKVLLPITGHIFAVE